MVAWLKLPAALERGSDEEEEEEEEEEAAVALSRWLGWLGIWRLPSEVVAVAGLARPLVALRLGGFEGLRKRATPEAVTGRRACFLEDDEGDLEEEEEEDGEEWCFPMVYMKQPLVRALLTLRLWWKGTICPSTATAPPGQASVVASLGWASGWLTSVGRADVSWQAQPGILNR